MELQFHPNFAYNIEHYQIGRVIIAKREYQSSLILTRTIVEPYDFPLDIQNLTSEHLDKIFKINPEICIFGTGSGYQLITAKWVAEFAKRNIGLEVMNSAAACRTFNVLVSEEREVLLALISL